MKIIFFAILLASFSLELTAQNSFSAGNKIGSDNFINGASSWGDYDNDGDLDLIVIGTPNNNSKTKLLKNNGNGTFTENLTTGLVNIGAGDVEWGDYNNDGLLDLVVVGQNNSSGLEILTTKIYKNLGNETFADVKASLTNVGGGSAKWGDFDNDGDLDLLICGVSSLQTFATFTALYRNDGNDSFINMNVGFDNLSQSDIALADYDNDGDLDVALAGYSGSIGITKIYQNNSDGTFSLTQSLTPAMRASLDWGDYNGDGYLDLVVSGFSGTAQTLSIYKNNQNNTFTKVTDPDFVGGEQGATLWIDFDNDGDLDIVSSTAGDGQWNTRLYTNVGGNDFTISTNTGLPIDISPIDIIDIDKDGDLDIFFPSTFNSANQLMFYTNNSSVVNSAPTAPSNLRSEFKGNSIVFTWSNSSDSQNAQRSISYNFYLRSNNATIISAQSLPSGIRKVIQPGNTQLRTKLEIFDLKPGEYYWSVQAIDNSYNASAFAPEQKFTFVVTGLESGEENQIVSLFPNPTSDFLQLIISDKLPSKVLVKIVDYLGKVVISNYYTKNEEEFTDRIDIRSIKSGVYFIKIRLSDKEYIKRIIIH
jgi:hypothetical protein